MKITLFERWRRASTKQLVAQKSRRRSRPLQVESLEERALLTANSVAAYSTYDVTHDGYVNVLDAIKIAGYVNTHGNSPVSASSNSGSGAGTATVMSLATTSTTTSASAMDVNHDGFVNVLDIVKEVQALDDTTPEAQYSLVPTDSSDTPLTGPINIGDTFYVDVYVQDLRSVSYAGIAAGDVDVTYADQGGGTAGVAPTGVITAGPNYPVPGSAPHGDATSTPGVVLNVQGSEPLNATGNPFFYQPLGSSPVLLDRIQMTANAAGTVQFGTQFSLGEVTVDAEDTGNNDPAQIPNNQILPGSASVTVLSAPPIPSSLSGSVYIDANGDNVQDNGEAGPTGVTVQLLDSSNTVIDSVTTGSNGIYSFTNLAPGTYSVHEVQPAGLIETGVTVGSIGGPAVGTASGNDTITGITLSSGSVAAGYSFAVQQPASISGTEYVDANANNTFDSGDTGLGGVTIQLLNSSNTLVNSATTASDGTYSFTNLLPGTYSLHETTPSGAGATAANLGTAGGTVTAVDTISSISLGSGVSGTGYNFATQTLGSISGTEYIDNNSDHVFNSGDAGLQGVTINLLDSSNTIIATQFTDSSGNFSFTSLPAGTYSVQEVSPASPYIESSANAGTPAGTLVGLNNITNIVLAAGTTGTGYDFGVTNPTQALAQYQLVATDASDAPISGSLTVGQTFYVDVKVQDLRGVAYAGIASGNVDVAYVQQGGGTAGASATGNIIAGVNYPVPTSASHGDALTTPGLVSNLQGTENINVSGNPFFTPLGSGTQILDRIEMTAVAPGVVVFNTQFSAGEATVVAELTGNNDPNQIPNSAILGGTTFVTIVAAPPMPASLSGTVFVDANGDNIQEAGDAGEQGVTVQLRDSSNQLVGTPQITDANGHYTFTGIDPGTYTVQEVQLAGFFESGAIVGSINGTPSGTATGLDTIGAVTLGSGATAVGYNFALQAPATLSGTEYIDTNGDNSQDNGEVGLPGVTVQLVQAGNAVQTKVTGADGSYSFTNVQPGTYTVQEIVPGSPYFATGSSVGTANGTQSGLNQITGVTIGSGTSATGYNFAVQQLATLSGVEYVDVNGNNTFDSGGDTPLSGVTIQLLNSNNVPLTSAVTAADGSYSFLVMPGNYTLHELPPPGTLVETVANIGLAGGVQSGVDTVASITVISGTQGTGYNFGVQSHVPFQAQVRLEATQLDGTEIQPGSTIPGGETFWLYEYVTDLRQPAADALGVLAAYTTITFDSGKFQVVSPLTFGTNYQNLTQPSGTPTNLSDVGAFAGSAGQIPPSLGNSEQMVFKVELQATGGGTSNIDPGQPDQSPSNPLGIILYPAPPATDSLPLPTAAIHFIGVDNIQTTQATFASINNSSVTNVTTNGATTLMPFTVHLSQPSSVPVTVNYSTASLLGDTGVAGVDYVGVANGQVVIPANATSATFNITVLGNSLNQADKTFHVNLTSATNNVVLLGSSDSALGTIHSGVPLPTVTVQPASGTEGGVAVFNVSLSAASGQTVTFTYSTQATNPVSAVPGVDFQVLTSQTITFLPGGPLTQQITVGLPLDPNLTAPAQFLLVLSTNANSHAVLASSSVLGTVQPIPFSSLSGFVYIDSNHDGVFDAGDSGYGGVAVQLTGTDIFGRVIAISTKTNTDGSYTFTGLAQGTYSIQEFQPQLLLEGSDSLGSQGGDGSVQDLFTVSLSAGVNGTGYNFGEAGVDPKLLWWPYF
ncbi:MAG TPA: SdrD B-like domain-containing protein [Pirellulales bacterium]|jgi:protocatechuate 3,4-dioxygenase beta subunit